MDKSNRKGRPFLIILVAVAILAALSLVPWGEYTGNVFKHFDLLSDITGAVDTTTTSNEIVDPALAKALDAKNNVAPVQADTDTVQQIIPLKEPRVNGEMVIEDYTPDQKGLKNLKAALAKRGKRPVRIAFLGDSYIEGDIITEQLRSLLQQKFSGSGVGYMAAQSDVAGFRQSVRHYSSDWTAHEISDVVNSRYFILPGRYHTAPSGASITYKGVKKPHLDKWNDSGVLFVAPSSGTITLTNDSVSQTFAVQGGSQVQYLRLPGTTSSFRVNVSAPGLVMLGSWLNDSTGVTVDNMSVRGDSGITRRTLNTSLSQDMAKYIDYDLIILEYGINALTAKKKDYSGYASLMGDVIEHIRQCYPNADILLLGIGDRGQKHGSEVHSMPSVPYMIAAQREVARDHGCLFWDIREAMGGEDAIVDWRERKLVNADYIHLNFQGGRVVGKSLFDSLLKDLSSK